MFLCHSPSRGLRVLLTRCMSWTPLVAPLGVVVVAQQNAASTPSKSHPSGWRHRRMNERAHSIHTASITRCKPENRKSVVDLAVAFSQRPMNGDTAMQCTDYRSHGQNTPSQLGVNAGVDQMTKLAIAETYGLSRRDLRVFDQPSPGAPHILVRPSSILVHLFDLRVVVQYDHVRLFHVARPDAHDLGSEAERARARDNDGSNGDANCVSRVFSHIMEEGTRGGHHQAGGIELPHYELYALDVALSSVTSVLEAEYLLTQRKVSEALQMTDASTLSGEESTMHSGLRTTLELKRKLTSIEQRARQIQTMAREILNEDEDMANMYLTDKQAGKPHAVHDHQSVEYLFEAYFKASDTIAGQAASLISRIRRTEETVQYTLSVRRNQIMVLEARLEILMLALAGATLVAGWYGMNVVNYSEKSPHAFAVVVLLSCAAVLVSSGYGLRKLWRIRTAQLRM